MLSLAALREKRAAKMDALKAITDQAANENRDLSDQENQAFEAGRTEVERIDRDIRNAEFLADAERRASAEPLSSGGRDTMANLEARVSVGKAIGEYAANGRLTGPEAEYDAENRSGRPGAISLPTAAFMGERRAGQNVSSGVDGGYLVQQQLGPLIDRLRPRLAIETMGATVISGLTGHLDLPRLSSSGSASWVGEGASPTRTEAQFGQVSMGPKTVAAEYALTRRAMIQAPQLEGILRRDIGLLLAAAMDAAAINGDGVGKPLGILEHPDVQVHSLGTNGGAPGVTLAAELIGLVEVADAMGNTSFLTNAKVKRTMLKLLDGEELPYSADALWRGEPISYSSQVPSTLAKGSGTNLSAILYGVWSELVLGYWSSVDILLNPYHSDVASSGGALLHAFLDCDTALRHGESFAVAKDVITT